MSALTIFLIIACHQNPATQPKTTLENRSDLASVDSTCQTISHDAGTITVCGQPERVVALDPHAMDLLLSLEVQPIGYAEVEVALLKSFNLGAPMQVKYLGDRMTQSPKFIGTRNQPSLEAILKLQPDLIVGEDATNYDALSRIAPTLLLAGTEANRWQKNIQTLAQVFEAQETAQAVIAAHNQKIAAVRATLAPVVAQKRALLLATDGFSFTAFHDKQDYAGNLLRNLGISLIAVGGLGDKRYPNLSLEVLPQLEADLIFVMTASNNTVDAERERWQQNAVLRSLCAYQNNQVYFVDYQLWSRIRGAIAADLIVDNVQELLNAEISHFSDRQQIR
ncbi:iron-siderophore ABC transporter substrate-binding protein [Gloeocapsopsis crepidinum LEGE 06123]|uniref:Iron-siderophore ABC transporter substrate-binding protein n=1 Tax=Gloeocapsopsis crepidinum LEGE 06123 TaxID=588587 RepID=A0ABR9UYF7_9CHRO|nr:iron-siderophore ABC transporter substrate-binding protein [Gloeocapsopsis crepidinum]MBE9193033.1 iron-siderophore ABC transporter substrate-binding protein [Gloeocapsopsis crepidinum LEGE 06123]